eukprot:CAMPEP_0183431294 /NCGR_PEP_ID=MMETSP0370-20130417/54724_1 /TAXON_ID=268820 /ORGANISM="Peridinium aciculiferum, Strain PAER-2" /LENGTH=89 /DNA_ID=CAMNT_0025616943 /DNA_START=281 /DNA_END=550 /DNA_ORIENTATION=-
MFAVATGTTTLRVIFLMVHVLLVAAAWSNSVFVNIRHIEHIEVHHEEAGVRADELLEQGVVAAWRVTSTCAPAAITAPRPICARVAEHV